MAGGIHSKRGTIHSKIRLKVLERNGFLKVKERPYLHWMEFSTHFRNPRVNLKCVENSIEESGTRESSEIFRESGVFYYFQVLFCMRIGKSWKIIRVAPFTFVATCVTAARPARAQMSFSLPGPREIEARSWHEVMDIASAICEQRAGGNGLSAFA